MPAAIFNGAFVKALRAGLNLFNNATIWSGAIDPSSVGFAANTGDLYISTSTAILYQKEASGNTAWVPVSQVGNSWKGAVANAAALPVSGNTAGDVHVTLDTNNAWEWTGSAWGIIAGPGVILSVGTIDSTSPSSDGAVDVNNSLVLQSASGTNPGLVNNTTQSFSGQKTFSTGLTGTLTGHATLDVPLTDVGVANGVASLDGGGKVPVSQLPSSVFEYQGNWDPTTNTPALADGTGTNGYVYYVSMAYIGPVVGLNDPSMVNFQIGDLVIYTASVGRWQLTTPAAGVQSVNGLQGVVTLVQGNLTDSTSGADGITITGGTNAVWGTGTSIAQNQSSGSQSGFLSSTDWSTFNGKQAAGNYITALTGDVTATGPGSAAAALTATTNSTITTLSALSLPASQLTGTGNLTDAGTDGITITGGTGAVIGTGTAISQHVADTTHNGYLSSTDWNTFNGKSTLPSFTSTEILFGDGTNTPVTSADFEFTTSGAALTVGTSTSSSSGSISVGGATSGTASISGRGTSISLSDGTISDSSSNLAIDINNRDLYFNDGVTQSVQWQSQLLTDSTGTNALSWLQTDRWLMDNSGIKSLDWNARLLTDSSGGTKLAWSSTGVAVNTGLALNGSSSGAITQHASAATTSYAVTWPAVQATGSQALLNNGSGTLSWTTVASPGTGDISQTSFSAANNQSSPTDVTGLAFANGSVHAFTAYVSIQTIATSNTYEYFELRGVQRAADWQMSSTSTGDSSGYTFSITTAGQVQYTNSNYAGFVSSTLNFRAMAV